MTGSGTGLLLWLFLWGGLGVWTVALVVTDLRSRRLPDVLTVPAAVFAAVWAVVTGVPVAVLGGVGWFLLSVLPGLLSRRLAAGGGDAKLALSLGTVAAGVGGVFGWLLVVGAASAVTVLLVLARRCVRVGRGCRTGRGCCWRPGLWS